VQSFIFLWCHTSQRISLLDFQFIVYPKFLAEPDDALRLRNTKMMHGDHVMGFL